MGDLCLPTGVHIQNSLKSVLGEDSGLGTVAVQGKEGPALYCVCVEKQDYAYRASILGWNWKAPV